jgi:site-specific DNA-cytosine methylase
MFRLVQECRPTWVIGENVFGFVSMGLDTVLSDLEGEGYTCWPLIIPACAVNAPHRRDRVWILAHASGAGCKKRDTSPLPDQQGLRAWGGNEGDASDTESQQSRGVFHPWLSGDWQGQAEEWVTESPVHRTHDGLSQKLDKDIGYLRKVLQHSIMGKTSAGGINYAEKNDTRPAPKLRVLRERIEEKNIQWQDGRQNDIFEAEVLREAMFWFSNGERRSEQESTSPKSQEALKIFLRELRYEKKSSCSPRRWKQSKQCENEYQDIVFILSLKMALAEWEVHAEKTVGVQNLWRACEEVGFMPKTLHEVENSWRSMPYEEKRWCVVCAGAGDRFHDWWPGVGGVSTEKIPSRVARLKALGNAVVPQIPELIGRAIMAASAIGEI